MPTYIENYHLISLLGEGQYAKVYYAEDDKGNKVALKKMKKNNPLEDEELDGLKNLSHTNLVNLIEYNHKGVLAKSKSKKEKTAAYVVIELCNGGMLFDFISQCGAFDEKFARAMYGQILDALEYLQAQGYAHRDLKPENILLDDEFNIKLADFGFVTDKEVSQTYCGTELYMAPQIHAGETYKGADVDLFASAIILFSMISGTVPFLSAQLSDNLYSLLVDGKDKKFWEVHSKSKPEGFVFSEEFKDLITKMFSYEPNDRANLEQIRGHAWFQGETATYDEIQEEFKERKAYIEENAQKGTDIPDDSPDSDKMEQNTTRGAGNQAGEDGVLPELKREAKVYVPRVKRITEFYSDAEAQKLFETLACFTLAEANNCDFSDTKYKVKMDVMIANQTLKVKASVLQVEGSEKRCVQFIKVTGDMFIFNEFYRKATQHFGGLVSTQQ